MNFTIIHLLGVSMKTLIVEDEPVTRIFYEKLFSEYGPTVGVGTAEEAEQLIKKATSEGDPFDLICLDIKLPKMSGLELLHRLRAHNATGQGGKSPKILMVTAYGDLKYSSEAFAEGCDGYVVKPVDQVKIREKLKSLGFV